MFCLVFINWLLFLCNCVLCFFARLRKCPRGREESFCAAASQIAPGRTIVDLPTWQCQSNKSLFLLSFCFSSFICYPLFHLFPLFKRCKICNIVFWIEHDSPPPPFGTFPKIHFGGATRPSVFEYPNIWMFFYSSLNSMQRHWHSKKMFHYIWKKSPKWRDIILMSVHH